MNVSTVLAPLALVAAVGAAGFTAVTANAANADTTQSDLRKANKRVSDLAALVEKQDKQIDALTRQSADDEIMRQCALEVGKMVNGGMQVDEYDFVSPMMQLSAPCNDWLYDPEGSH